MSAAGYPSLCRLRARATSSSYPSSPRASSCTESIAPGLTNVTDVAWERGTSLAVLAAAAGGGSQVVVWRVPVDGSAAPAAIQRPGLPGDALAVAAAPGRPLVVSAVLKDQRRLYRDNGTLFRRQGPGSSPFYPG